MDTSRRQFLGAFLALSLTDIGSNDINGQSRAQFNGFVKARGKDIVDPGGQKVRLRGINLGNWLEPEGYMFLFKDGPQSTREIEALFNELIGPTAAATFGTSIGGDTSHSPISNSFNAVASIRFAYRFTISSLCLVETVLISWIR